MWVRAADLRAGKEGFTGHAQISEAWREVDHTDPGAGFPHDVVLSRAQQIVNDPDSSSGEDSMCNDEILSSMRSSPLCERSSVSWVSRVVGHREAVAPYMI